MSAAAADHFGKMKPSHVMSLLGLGLAVLAAAAAAVAIVSDRVTLSRGPSAAAAPAGPPPVNAASARVQSELEGLLSNTLGPGRAVVAADVAVNAARSSSVTLSYGRRGTALASRSGNATGHTSRSTAFGVSRKVTTTTAVPGAVRSIHVAVLVASTVPAPTVKSLRGVLFAAAGLSKRRGDRLSIAVVPFPTAPKKTLAAQLQACLHGASGC